MKTENSVLKVEGSFYYNYYNLFFCEFICMNCNIIDTRGAIYTSIQFVMLNIKWMMNCLHLNSELLNSEQNLTF
jgi:hypothetical protein